MRITLNTVRHYGGRHGNEVQVRAGVARGHEDADVLAVGDTLIAALREAARENFIRLYLFEDKRGDETAQPLGLGEPKSLVVALKARLSAAEQQAKHYKAKFEELARKVYMPARMGGGGII